MNLGDKITITGEIVAIDDTDGTIKVEFRLLESPEKLWMHRHEANPVNPIKYLVRDTAGRVWELGPGDTKTLVPANPNHEESW